MKRLKYILVIMIMCTCFITKVSAETATECKTKNDCIRMCLYKLENGTKKKRLFIFMEMGATSTTKQTFSYTIYSVSSNDTNVEEGKLDNLMNNKDYQQFASDGKCPKDVYLSKSAVTVGHSTVQIGEKYKSKDNYKDSTYDASYSYSDEYRKSDVKKYLNLEYICGKIIHDSSTNEKRMDAEWKNLQYLSSYPLYIKNLVSPIYNEIIGDGDALEEKCSKTIENNDKLTDSQKKKMQELNEENTKKNSEELVELRQSLGLSGVELRYEEGVTDCSDLFGKELLDLIKRIYGWIIIGVPILIIVLGMFDFSSAVLAQKEDEMKKAQSNFIKRLLIGVVIMLIPLLVVMIIGLVNFVGVDNDGETFFKYISGDECVSTVTNISGE